MAVTESEAVTLAVLIPLTVSALVSVHINHRPVRETDMQGIRRRRRRGVIPE
ncbi:hypothetical protein ECP03052936_1011 [Escherichia coli p0305293.6]|nr:hypothetical protein ECP03052936_1011 [Escherichia coli p0305293.6]